LSRNGFTVALHNRSVEKTDALLAKHGTDGDFIRTETLQELVDSLEKPRRVLIMVKAARGWSERGPIKTASRIDVPRNGGRISAGTVTFGGVAWSQHTGIGKVELRVNRGRWQQAVLAPGISKDTWYQRSLGMELTPGQYEVQVRATDLSGQPQAEEPRPVAPDGATGYHTIRVDVNP
jgi:hypothetical protein